MQEHATTRKQGNPENRETRKQEIRKTGRPEARKTVKQVHKRTGK